MELAENLYHRINELEAENARLVADLKLFGGALRDVLMVCIDQDVSLSGDLEAIARRASAKTDAEFARLTAERDQYKADYERLDKEVAGERVVNAQLEEALGRAKAERDAARAGVERLMAEYDRDMSASNETLAETLAERDTARGAVGRLTDKIRAVSETCLEDGESWHRFALRLRGMAKSAANSSLAPATAGEGGGAR